MEKDKETAIFLRISPYLNKKITEITSQLGIQKATWVRTLIIKAIDEASKK